MQIPQNSYPFIFIHKLKLCLRASYTLGGAGASIVHKKEDFDELLSRGLEISPIHEVMIDKALLGWKEYELELLRDKNDNVVIIVLSKIWILWESILVTQLRWLLP